MKNYTVYKGDNPVGTVQVSQQGLYHRISLHCREPMRVYVAGDRGYRDLGLCVPMADGFGLATSVPVKQLGNGNLIFQAAEQNGMLCSVDPDKPFPYLKNLRNASLIQRDGKPWLHMSISSPTGQ